MNNIYIYTSSGCTYCHKAKKLFKLMGLEFTEHDVSDSFEQMQKELNEKYSKNNISTVPQIIINNTYIGGYDDLEQLYKEDKLKDILN